MQKIAELSKKNASEGGSPEGEGKNEA